MNVLASLSADDSAIVVLIVAARLLIPLLIPYAPLVIMVAFTLDAVDGTLLERLTAVDTGPGGAYQSWDKALDIYYLSIAYVSTMRNWDHRGAFRIAQFLFYYRLVGIAAFEMTGERTLLLVFPNTFEFFFIAYELVRTRFNPLQFSTRFWLLVAGGLWVFVKLPQEYWIHVAQLDFTDAVADHPWLGVLAFVALVAAVAAFQFVVRPRMPKPSWNWRLRAGAAVAQPEGSRSARSLIGEKVALLGLLSLVFAEILPSVDWRISQVIVGVAFIVVTNTLLTKMWPPLLLAVNLILVYVASLILTSDTDFQLGPALFFAFLFTLIITLFDRFSGAKRFAGAKGLPVGAQA